MNRRGGGLEWTGAIWGTGAIASLIAVLIAASCGKPKPKSPPAPSAGSPPAAASSAPGAEPPAPPPLAGWAVTFAGSQAVAHAPWAALALEQGQSVSPHAAPSPLKATYSGLVTIDASGKTRLTVEGEGGSARLTIFDGSGNELASVAMLLTAQSVLQTPWLELKPGAVSVSVEFTRVGDAGARLRTLWEQELKGLDGFAIEPIPPSSVTPPKFVREKAGAALAARQGRVLLGVMGCAHCHATTGAAHEGHESHAEDPMILAPMGPLLGDVARRASAEWLTKWIADPQRLRPGSHMPDLFGDSDKDKAEAQAVVHFLASIAPPSAWEGAPPDSTRGRELFHTVGCIACHGPLESSAFALGKPDLAAEKPTAVVPHAYGEMTGKWNVAALREFLKDPKRIRPGGRMPSLSLTDDEAAAIAGYLGSQWKSLAGVSFTPDPAKADIGKAVFSAKGCASCHALGTGVEIAVTSNRAKPVRELDVKKGCLDPKSTTSPRYTFSASDRDQLNAAIAEMKGVHQPAASRIDRAERLVEVFNCRACHDKDGRGGPDAALDPYFRCLSDAELGEEGRKPPRLTGVAGKLTTKWLSDVLLKAGRVRPYVATRMPQFGQEHVGTLARDFGAAEGMLPGTGTTAPEGNPEMVLAGRALIGEKGLNCISCHLFADGPPAGTPGPDLTTMAPRLRYSWFTSYMMEPGRFKPGTKMTAFFKTLDGTGQIKSVLGGDTAKQTQALWAYLATGAEAPRPEGLPGANSSMLPIGDTPLVFRSFLRNGGARGIAVGYPIGINFAFDAENVRLVEAWKGEFLNPAGIWAARGGQDLSAGGQLFWNAPDGPAIALTDGLDTPPSPETPRPVFKGYTLDGRGWPTFSYTVSGATVHERFEPGDGAVLLRRSFTVSGHGGRPIWIASGKNKFKISSSAGATVQATDHAGGTVWVRARATGSSEATVVLDILRAD